MSKVVLFGKEARDKILEGVRKISRATKVTLGPRGRNILVARGAVIDYGFRQFPTVITKDGVSVCRAFELSDPIENIGVNVIKEAAQKTVEMAGDATTGTVVLAEAMIEAGMKYLNENENANPIEVKKGMDKTVEDVIFELKKMATSVGDDNDRIRQVGTVSSNNDAEIGALIAEAYSKIGKDGVINLEEGNGFATTVKTTDGFQFDSGYLSPYFINNKSKPICEFDDPYIFLYDKNISLMKQIDGISIQAHTEGRPLVYICDDVDGEALAWLLVNKGQSAMKVCVVKSPSFGDSKMEYMEDIAALTGGTYLSSLKGIAVEKAQIRHLGQAKKIIITKDETIIIGGAKDVKRKEELIAELQMNRVDAKEDRDKKQIEQRIARLNGAVAVIEVGGPTRTEMQEKKDRLDDALMSVKAAISEGFVPGGGTAFIKCLEVVAIDGRKSSDFQKGQEIILNALTTPMVQICTNAGVDGKKLLDEVRSAGGNFGYNAQSEKVEDLVEAGIIDATKVLRASITNAASVAGMLLTSEGLIADTL